MSSQSLKLPKRFNDTTEWMILIKKTGRITFEKKKQKRICLLWLACTDWLFLYINFHVLIDFFNTRVLRFNVTRFIDRTLMAYKQPCFKKSWFSVSIVDVCVFVCSFVKLSVVSWKINYFSTVFFPFFSNWTKRFFSSFFFFFPAEDNSSKTANVND